MNEAHDPFDRLEAELAALRPHDGSPELRRRIAERRADSPPTRSRWLWGSALAGGLAAACLAAAILLGRGGGPGVPTGPTTVPIPPEPRRTSDDSQFALRVYQYTLARSPEELDALLDEHAVRASQPDPKGARIYAYPRSEAEIDALLGEI